MNKMTVDEKPGGTLASSFIVNIRADEDFFYVLYQISDATKDASLGVVVGLDGGKAITNAADKGEWSLAIEDWADFTSNSEVKCRFNDEQGTRDMYLPDMEVQFGPKQVAIDRSGKFGGQQILEFAISMNVLISAFRRTYTSFNGTLEPGDKVTVSGYYVHDYKKVGWKPAHFGKSWGEHLLGHGIATI